jgi:hypothetical protein
MPHNRQTAKERGLKKDIERERHKANNYGVLIAALTAFIADDAVAASYQTLGQYRSALLDIIEKAL